jgi:dolichol-phosphate mannosyltransferase
MDPVELSVVIPVYNEEENIQILANELKESLNKLGMRYEIIFVDDGSEDGTFLRIQEACSQNGHIRAIIFENNSGQTAAMNAGFRAALGHVIVTLDGDLQNSPKDIPLLLEKIPEYDLVCGWRKERKDSWIRRASSRVANSIRNKLSSENIKDTSCSLKAYRRECLDRIKLYNGMHRFLPTLFKMEGFRVFEVSVDHHPRRFGRSKYNIRNRVLHTFLDLLVVRWMKKRQLDYRIRKEI